MLGFFPLTRSAAALGALVLLLGVGSVGYYAGQAGQQGRDVEAPPDTVRRTRTITKTDTVTRTVAETVVRYDTVRTTDTIRVPVPSGFRYMGAIERQPLDLTEDQATLTYFRGGRYIQKRYDIPEPTWSLAPTLGVEAAPSGLVARGGLTVSYKAVSALVGYEVTARGRGWTVGIQWRPVEWSW